jgi:uncharacterized membrane protein YfcA
VDIFSAAPSGDIGVLALGLAIAGVVSGIAAGMLGIGGGIVIVPVLYHVLAMLGVDASVCMQLAIGTSLATMIPTAYSAAATQSQLGMVDWPLTRRWMIPMLVGVLAGAALAGVANGRTLALIFAVAAVPVAAYYAFGGENRRLADHLPQGPAGSALPVLIGGSSTMMGVDGSTLGAPVMALCGVPMPRAMGTASVLTVVICVPGTLGAIIAGWHAQGLPPYSLGYVNIFGFLLIAPSTFLAPFGARIADQVDTKRMRIVFAAFIAIATARMLFDALA